MFMIGTEDCPGTVIFVGDMNVMIDEAFENKEKARSSAVRKEYYDVELMQNYWR